MALLQVLWTVLLLAPSRAPWAVDDVVRVYYRALATGRFRALEKAATVLERAIRDTTTTTTTTTITTSHNPPNPVAPTYHGGTGVLATHGQRDLGRLYFYLGLARHHLGQHALATAALLRARQRDPNNARIHENLGVVSAAAQDWTAAARHYHAAVEREPDTVELHVGHAMMWYRAGDAYRGARLFADAVDRFPMSADARYELGRSNELLHADADYERDIQSNFTAALALAWQNLAGPEPVWQLVRRKEWRTIADSEAKAVSGCRKGGGLVAHRPVGIIPTPPAKGIAITEFREVDVCGNDGVVVHHSTKRVFLPSFGPQIPLHRNLRTVPPVRAHTSTLLPTGRPAILLVQLFAVGFYHWLLEVLPRLVVSLEQFPFASIIVPANGGTLKLFMNRTLEMLGVTAEQLVLYELPSDPIAAAQCRLSVPHLIHVDWVPVSGGDVAGAVTHLPAVEALERARHALRPHDAPARPEPFVIWIQRTAAASRRIANESALVEVVREMARAAGLSVVIFSDFPHATPPRRALDLFARAAAVIGMHGAGLAHIVACCRGVAVFEIMLPEPHAVYYQHVADSLHLVHTGLVLDGDALYARREVHIPEAPFSHALVRVFVDAQRAIAGTLPTAPAVPRREVL
jgi:hypothetical protein